MDKKQIIIDGEKYNKCNGCKLWDGYICTGDRSYEPNAEAHRVICNEHMAKEFWKVYHELFYKTQELDEYKQSLDEKNKFLQDLGISASGEFKRIKFYIESLKNKYNEKAEECEELISEKDFYLQKIAVLEQECEELKEQIKQLKDTIKREKEAGYSIIERLL